MPNPFFRPYQEENAAIEEQLKKEFQTIRTGRASSAVIEDIPVEVYGTRGALKHYATITVSDPKTLMVQPWDPQTTKDIERSLASESQRWNVSMSQTSIRVRLPDMTEENRKEFVKTLKEKHEQARTRMRQLRDKFREIIQRQEREKQRSQDDKFRLLKELDELTATAGERLRTLTEQKEKEVMTL